MMMSRTRWTAAAVALVAGTALVAGGCSGSGGDAGAPGDGTTPPTTELAGPVAPLTSIPPDAHSGPAPPPIESFEVPGSVSCTAGDTAKVPVTYKTQGSMTVTFLVDMTQVEGQPPLSGSYDIPVPCDGTAHTIVIFAVANDTSTSTRSRAVMTGA
jgi:hypothetical protein